MLQLAALLALQAAPNQDLLTIQHAPVAEMLRHPKDVGLARLLAAAPAALERFLATQGEAPPPGMVALAVDLFTAGKSIVVGLDPGADVPIRASFLFGAHDAAAAERRAAGVTELLALAGVAHGAPLTNGLQSVDTPLPMPVALGTVGTDLALTIGNGPLARPAPVEAGLPRGVQPWLQFFQAGGASELLGEGEGDAALSAMLMSLGPWDSHTALGSDGQHLWGASTIPGGAKALREHGAIPAGGLAVEALARIPADATYAFALRADWNGVFTLFESYVAELTTGLGAEAPDMRAELAAELGFDLFTEVLPHFGPTAGMYLSDTTGGSGLTSAVAFVEVRDAAAVGALSARLVAWIEAEAAEDIAVRVHRVDGLELTSFVAPGVPIPVVPTWVIDGGYLYLGLSPQAAVAAVEAARAGGGLPQNPRFKAGLAQLGYDPSVAAVSFMDIPELLGDGYAWMGLGLDALGNLVREKGVPDELGLLLPSLGALGRGAEASVGVVRLQGDDVVTLSCSDPSWAVNVTGTLGLMDRSGLLMALPLLIAEAQGSLFGGSDDAEWDETAATWYDPLMEGGSLVELSDWIVAGLEEPTGAVLAQLESHLDDDTGTLSIYVVDAEVTGYVRTAQTSLVVTVYPEEGDPYELTLQHVANELTGEVAGDSSHYRVTDPRLEGTEYFNGMIGSLTIGEATFESVSFWCFAP